MICIEIHISSIISYTFINFFKYIYYHLTNYPTYSFSLLSRIYDSHAENIYLIETSYYMKLLINLFILNS